MGATDSVYQPAPVPRLKVFVPPSALAASRTSGPYDLSEAPPKPGNRNPRASVISLRDKASPRDKSGEPT